MVPAIAYRPLGAMLGKTLELNLATSPLPSTLPDSDDPASVVTEPSDRVMALTVYRPPTNAVRPSIVSEIPCGHSTAVVSVVTTPLAMTTFLTECPFDTVTIAVRPSGVIATPAVELNSASAPVPSVVPAVPEPASRLVTPLATSTFLNRLFIQSHTSRVAPSGVNATP